MSVHLNRRRLLGVALALPALGLGLRARAAAASSIVVETAYGRIRGLADGGVVTFKGIPYGADTSGANRFMPPQPPLAWSGVRDAMSWGPSAPQLSLTSGRPRIGGYRPPDFPESEDCLVLNVWTPATDHRKRPVMVWLHGGNFTAGSGSDPRTNGANLARSQDVVVVTLNHRLNVLGYADLGLVSDEFASAANVGMLDIVAALSWIRENIDRFGGDPARVMVFGESGGGRKTATLLAMPAGKELFHRAAIQSAANLQSRTRERSKVSTEALLHALDVPPDDVRRIQKVPLERLMAAALAVSRRGEGGFQPVVDGDVLPRHPFTPDAPPTAAGVPLIIGYNREDISYITANHAETFSLDEAGLKRRVEMMFDPRDAKRVLESYRSAHPQLSPSDLYFRIGTDQWLGIASTKIAERKSAQEEGPSWLYRFDWPTPVDDGKWRSPHTLEIPFVFANVLEPKVKAMVGETPDVALAARMSAAWASFARTGNPNHDGLAHWPAYSTARRDVMLFDSASRVVRDPGSEQRRLMDEIAFREPGGRGDRALAAAR